MKNLILSLITVVIVAVLGFGWLIGLFYQQINTTEPQQQDELSAYKHIGRGFADILDASNDSSLLLAKWQARDGMNAALQDISSLPIPESLQIPFLQGEVLPLEADNGVSLYFYMPNSQQILSLHLPDNAIETPVERSSLILTLAFYGGLIVVLLLWLYPLIVRLLSLQRAAIAFGQGDLSKRIKTNKVSYINNIESEFNNMADRIQTLLNDNKLLSRAVSHDLKTPLARLRFGVDTLYETQNPDLRTKYSQRIDADLCEMESLVNTLLQYARLDESNIQLHPEHIDLVSFVETLSYSIDTAGIRLKITSDTKPLNIQADTRYLAMLINNIINNAVNHAQQHIMINISLYNKQIRLMIEDDGPGIPEHERDNALKPFWRGENTEAPSKGHGMGLAIAHRISEWLGASLSIQQSSQLGGAAICICYKQI